jgi:hypothetical protein
MSSSTISVSDSGMSTWWNWGIMNENAQLDEMAALHMFYKSLLNDVKGLFQVEIYTTMSAPLNMKRVTNACFEYELKCYVSFATSESSSSSCSSSGLRRSGGTLIPIALHNSNAIADMLLTPICISLMASMIILS